MCVWNWLPQSFGETMLYIFFIFIKSVVSANDWWAWKINIWWPRPPWATPWLHHCTASDTKKNNNKKNLHIYSYSQWQSVTTSHLNIFHQKYKVYLHSLLISCPDKHSSQKLQTFTNQILQQLGTSAYQFFFFCFFWSLSHDSDMNTVVVSELYFSIWGALFDATPASHLHVLKKQTN